MALINQLEFPNKSGGDYRSTKKSLVKIHHERTALKQTATTDFSVQYSTVNAVHLAWIYSHVCPINLFANPFL